MIGTTFKLGYDGTSVSRGLGKLTSSLGRGLGRIGVGALERVGHRVTDLMGRIVMAIPETLKETADWAGGLTDMSTATEVSVRDLVLLEEKFRLAGVSAKESGAIVNRFAANIQEAAENGGPAADALKKMGIYAHDFAKLPLDEQFKTIVQGLADMNPQESASIMADIFGGKLGYQQLKLFKDWAAVSAQAENNVGKLADKMNEDAAGLDRWSDALGRFENFKRSLASIFLDSLIGMTGGAGGVDRLFDWLDPEKLRPAIERLGNFIGRNLEAILDDSISTDIGDIFTNIGKKLGDGIVESLKSSLGGSLSLKDLLLGGIGAPSAPIASTDAALTEMQRQTALLREISRQEPVAAFA